MPAAETQIRINTLLLEREALFLRVHELEHAASAILGEPFPFALPAIPSTARRKKGKAKPRQPATAPKFKLRKLEAHEVAYRVTYQDHDDLKTEEHDTPNPLQTLLAAQGKTLAVQSIETLDATGTPVEQLYPEKS